MMKHVKSTKFTLAAVALATAVGVSACSITDDLLSVSNPEEIPITDLNSEQLVGVLVNGVIGDFTHFYDDPFIWRGSMFTDEQITGINWEQTARLSQRIVRFDEGDADGMFSAASQAVRQGEDVANRIRPFLDDPASDDRLALTLAFAGYSYIGLADAMCEAVISLVNPETGEIDFGSEILQPAAVYARAIPHFEEAVQIALAGGEDDIANLARTGLARAHLNMGNMADVITWASQVPTGFQYWLEYSSNSNPEELVLQSRVTGGNHSLGVHPNFVNGTFGDLGIVATQTDPRLQHTPDWSLGHNRLTRLYKPYQGLRFSGYNGETIATGGEPILFEDDTDILLADYVEAQHHLAEAQGPTAATATFVNDRRAFGNQAAVTLTGDALMTELRDQRALDLYLGGFRLGDLRRWIRLGVGDFFPTGPHANEQWGHYGDATCFPLPLEEYEGNPNLTKP